MLPNKTVSIIIPVLNSARTIGDCLEGVLKQDYPHERFEIIVVDNGSTDGSVPLIKKYPVALLDELRAHNSYMARNKGIRNSSGDILIFLDADCIPRNDWLVNMLRPFADEAVGCVAGEVINAPSRNLIQGFYDHVNFLGQEKKVMNGFRSLGAGNTAIRREVFDQIGLFDEAFRWGGDNDFGQRMQQESSFQVGFEKKAVVEHVHRHSLKGLMRQAFTYGMGKGRFRLKHADSVSDQSISQLHNSLVLLRMAAGIFLVPLRCFQIWRSGKTLREGIAYSILDKLFMLIEQSGIVYYLNNNRL